METLIEVVVECTHVLSDGLKIVAKACGAVFGGGG